MANNYVPYTRKKLNRGRESKRLNHFSSDINGLLEKGLDLIKIFRDKRRKQKKFKPYG